jgi:hypothetical protein
MGENFRKSKFTRVTSEIGPPLNFSMRGKKSAQGFFRPGKPSEGKV